jgi:hypothetical protein
MVNGSPDRLAATFKETGGNVRLTVKIEGDEVIFPGKDSTPLPIKLTNEEVINLREAIISLKSSNPEEEYPSQVVGRDLPMRILQVTQPPTLALKVAGSPYNPRTPKQLSAIREIVGQARSRIARP